MTREEFEKLGVSTDIAIAASALNISKSLAYQLARDGKFPVPVIRVGGRYSVPTAGLRQALGIEAVAI